MPRGPRCLMWSIVRPSGPVELLQALIACTTMLVEKPGMWWSRGWSLMTLRLKARAALSIVCTTVFENCRQKAVAILCFSYSWNLFSRQKSGENIFRYAMIRFSRKLLEIFLWMFWCSNHCTDNFGQRLFNRDIFKIESYMKILLNIEENFIFC